MRRSQSPLGLPRSSSIACRFVNLNLLGLHKILKKHDKKMPNRACRQFYIAQLHKQPWLSGQFSDVLVRLSGIFSTIRGDTSGVKNEDAAQVFSCSLFGFEHPFFFR
jgi:SPX domain protein involved in polyphosphate accumulation